MSQANQPRQAGGTPQHDHGVLLDPTDRDISQVEAMARSAVEALAVENEQSISNADDVDVRDLIPPEDLDSGGDNDWTTSTRAWEQTGLTADQFNHTYTVDADGGNADGKYIALFAISNLAAVPGSSEVRFETGNGAIFERLQVEGLLTDEEVTGLLADPLVVQDGQQVDIYQYLDGETSDEIVLHGAVAERRGSTLEESTRFLSEQR